jgi:hypothetical protein
MINVTLPTSDEFCAAIYSQVRERLNELPREGEYLSSQLCGADYWDFLTPGEKKTAGKCILKLAEIGLLPLAVIKKRHEYPLVFVLL